MSRQIRLNAFDMNCVAHQSPGLWTHPHDRADRYNTLVVGFVFGEQQDRTSLAMEEIVAENRIARGDDGVTALRVVPQRWFRLLRPPGPEVAEPQGRQHVDLSLSASAIGYADQQVRRR